MLFILPLNGETLSSYLNSMKSLLTQLASIKINIDEDIVIVVLLKGLLDEEYGHVITTLTNLTSTSLVKVEVALLEEETKVKAWKEDITS